MIKAKQVNINKNKCHTNNINDLDPFLLDINPHMHKFGPRGPTHYIFGD